MWVIQIILLKITERMVYRLHNVHLSACPSVDGIKSALYLPQYPSDPFHFYISYQPTPGGASSVNFRKIHYTNICLFFTSGYWAQNMTLTYDSSWPIPITIHELDLGMLIFFTKWGYHTLTTLKWAWSSWFLMFINLVSICNAMYLTKQSLEMSLV